MPRRVSLAQSPLPALAVTSSVLGLLAVGLASEDAWLERSIELAMDKGGQRTASTRVVAAPVAGSESYWLSPQRTEAVRPASWRSGIKVGARVRLGAPGLERELEVIDVSNASLAHGSDRVGLGDGMLILSLRDTSDPAAGLVRLVVDADTAARLSGTSKVADHAL